MMRVAGFAAIAIAVHAGPGLAAEAKQRTFSSPEQAAEALFVAVQRDDEKALSQLFAGDTEILSGGDEIQDDHCSFVWGTKRRWTTLDERMIRLGAIEHDKDKKKYRMGLSYRTMPGTARNALYRWLRSPTVAYSSRW